MRTTTQRWGGVLTAALAAVSLVLFGAVSPAVAAAPPTISGATEIQTEVEGFVSETYTFDGDPQPSATFTGELPAGLTFTTQSNPDGSLGGLITGTVAEGAGGEYRIFIQASNGQDPDAELPVLIVVTQTPSIGTGPADPIRVGEALDFQFALGGWPVPTVSVAEGDALPPGVELTAGGLLQGTPTTSGDYTFTVLADNGIGAAIPQLVVLLVEGPPRITGPTIIVDGEGNDFEAQYVREGWPLATWSVSGDMPPGISFDVNNGLLSGTIAGSGVFRFTITATNGFDPAAQLEVEFTANGAPRILGLSSGDATVGEEFFSSVIGTGWPAPQYSIADGSSLPPGILLGTDGRFSGTPTASGFYTFTVEAENDYGTAQSQIDLAVDGPLRLDGPAELVGVVGEPFSAQYEASGYPSGTYAHSGTLPAGLSLNPTTGVLSGTVNAEPGTYAFEIIADNGFDPADTLPVSFIAASYPGLTGNTPDAFVGMPYSHQLPMTGYPTPTAAIDPGDLPPGLTLSPGGLLSGTPTAEGSFGLPITLTNPAGMRQTPQLIRIRLAAPTITTESLPAGVVGQPYSATLAAVGSGVITWDLAPASGALPAGIALASDGALSGTPTQSGSFSVTVRATNSEGAVTKPLVLTVAELPGAPTIVSLAGGDAEVTVTFAPGAAGTDPTTGYEIAAHNITDPTQPDVVQAGPGSPQVVGGLINGDGYTFTVRALSDDGPGPWSAPSNALTVGVAPTITAADPPPMVVGQPYRYEFEIVGSPTPQVSMPGIDLPEGLTFSTEENSAQGTLTGVISGTPVAGAQSTFVFVQAINALGEGQYQFTLPLREGDVLGGADPGTPGLPRGEGGGLASTGGMSGPAVGVAMLALVFILIGAGVQTARTRNRRAEP